MEKLTEINTFWVRKTTVIQGFKVTVVNRALPSYAYSPFKISLFYRNRGAGVEGLDKVVVEDKDDVNAKVG